MEGRVDHGGRGRFNNPDADWWRKKPVAVEPMSTTQNLDHHPSVEAAGKVESGLLRTDESEPLAPMFDPSDSQAQVIFWSPQTIDCLMVFILRLICL